MREHYRIDPKLMPRWLERIYDILLAICIGLVLAGVLFQGE